ncbi:MAG: hypothetical protein RLY86_3513 [Pseudomonadota bacterium]|jgi:DMSO/TMAO reductase YedYZ molybdopterin-dependent catalytic subunit
MPNWAKLAERKEAWAREGRLLTGRRADPATDRLPPGQERVRDWPVLDLGTRPVIPPRDWRLTVGGMVRKPLRWDWRALERQPQVSPTADIHCVTGWSRFDNRWHGVALATLLDLVQPRPEADVAIIKGFDGYTTCLTLADLRREGVLLATHWEGQPLTREHGGPVRLVVPHLYFWKSAKWLRQLWFTDREVKGTWEARGYHRRGDPWREERYGP